MTGDEVISLSKLLSKALKLGVIRDDDIGYTVTSHDLYFIDYGKKDRTWCYKKDDWVAITSVEQVEAVFRRTLRDGE